MQKIILLTPQMVIENQRIYWFRHWHNGDQWLDGYQAESAFEALLVAKDNHSNKYGTYIELIDFHETKGVIN